MCFDFCLTFSRCLILLCQSGAFMLIPEGRPHLASGLGNWLELFWPYVLRVTSQVLWDGASPWQPCLKCYLILPFSATGSWGPESCSPDHFTAIWKWVSSVFLLFSAVISNDSRLPLWSWGLWVENTLQRIQAGGVFQVCLCSLYFIC